MENNYWIIDECLIFKPEFNEGLLNYYDIINKYKKIMFSNYNEPLIALETNNKYENQYKNNYIDIILCFFLLLYLYEVNL